MPIHAATITKGIISAPGGPSDNLVDAMIAAQKTLGQINWDNITADSAHGTYRDTTTDTAEGVTVIDTASAAIRTVIQDWIAANS